MFGGPKSSATPPPNNDGRPQAGEVAQIAGSLVHVFITEDIADNLFVFHNGKMVPAGRIESIGIEIVAPSETAEGILTGLVTHYKTGADGNRTTEAIDLFPGTVEIVAKGKRVSVTCADDKTFEGLFLRFGTENDGIGLEANGVQSLRVVITPELRDIRLVWGEDGREDVILS